MDRPQVPRPWPRPPDPPREVIPPYEVWTTLALHQQHHFCQTLVAICQELVATGAAVPRKEVRDD
jgi:hypothetical protein